MERLSAQIREVTIESTLGEELPPEKFELLLNKLSTKLTYFQEAIVLVEKDDEKRGSAFTER